MKSTKCSVAIKLINPKNEKEFLLVKRPMDDDTLPNVWGLPAVTLKEGELPEDAVKRVGEEKLNTKVESVSFVGIKYKDKETFHFILMDIQAKLTGNEPSVHDAHTVNTKYVNQKWTSDLNELKEAASKGSLCTQIILDKNNVSY